MALKLMFITNNPSIALIAEKNGVDRIWVDLEVLGKEERQKNLNSVKSHHSIDDIYKLSKVLTKSELMVRINPWNETSLDEIEKVIIAGAKRIMLPMWKSKIEVSNFLNAINKRVCTTLLLETKEAVECLDDVLQNPLIDEVHIGLNDLHLSYGLSFMFELLANGMVESLCKKFQVAHIPYGFGGIARLGEGTIPAEKIMMEHYRLGSTRAILSRSFCNTELINRIEDVEMLFSSNMITLRNFEKELDNFDLCDFEKNKIEVAEAIEKIVSKKV